MSTEGLIPVDHPIGKIQAVVDAVLAEVDEAFPRPLIRAPTPETVRLGWPQSRRGTTDGRRTVRTRALPQGGRCQLDALREPSRSRDRAPRARLPRRPGGPARSVNRRGATVPRVKELERSEHLLGERDALEAAFAEHGYLFFRDVIDPD